MVTFHETAEVEISLTPEELLRELDVDERQQLFGRMTGGSAHVTPGQAMQPRRDALDRDVADFLANGGQIEVLPTHFDSPRPVRQWAELIQHEASQNQTPKRRRRPAKESTVMTSDTETLEGPDFLAAVADAELVAGNHVNASIYRDRAKQWSRDRKRLEDQDIELQGLRDTLRRIQKAAQA